MDATDGLACAACSWALFWLALLSALTALGLRYSAKTHVIVGGSALLGALLGPLLARRLLPGLRPFLAAVAGAAAPAGPAGPAAACRVFAGEPQF